MAKSKTSQTKEALYRGFVLPGKWDEKHGFKSMLLSTIDADYVLNCEHCKSDPSFFLDSYVEVAGTIQRRSGSKVLSISSIKEIPDADGDDDFELI